MRNSSVQSKLKGTPSPTAPSEPPLTDVPPDNTPAISIPYTPITPDTTPNDIIRSDFDLTNVAGVHLYRHWCKPSHSIKELALLFSTTIAFTRHRRKLMDMPYGTDDSPKDKRAVVYPVD